MTAKSPKGGLADDESRDPSEADVLLVRHAKATDQSYDAELADEAPEQIEALSERILDVVVNSGGGIIRVGASPVPRGWRTGEGIEKELTRLITERGITNVLILPSRRLSGLRSGGVIGPLTDRGIEDPVQHWLENPGSVDGVSPEAVAERLRKITFAHGRVSERAARGMKLFYVLVTHEVPQAALLHEQTGKTINELGGGVENCEFIHVRFRPATGEPPEASFRGLHFPLRRVNDEPADKENAAAD